MHLNSDTHTYLTTTIVRPLHYEGRMKLYLNVPFKSVGHVSKINKTETGKKFQGVFQFEEGP